MDFTLWHHPSEHKAIFGEKQMPVFAHAPYSPELTSVTSHALKPRGFTRGRKWRETGEDYIMRSFIMCTLYQILLG
jgi:hypothetical protein